MSHVFIALTQDLKHNRCMKYLILCFLFLTTQVQAATYKLSQDIYKNENVSFLIYDNYLTMNINYDPIKKLLVQLNDQSKIPLKNRGESHITVVTPIEYDNVLNKYISIHEINAIAARVKIQKTPFEVVCIGKGSVKIRDKEESTFYIVIKSPGLLNIRNEIHKLFVKKGGANEAFNPDNYHPHITLGFTNRDLHESDGIIKDKKSCVAEIKTGLF